MKVLDSKIIGFNTDAIMANCDISMDSIESYNIYIWLEDNLNSRSYTMEINNTIIDPPSHSIWHITIFGKENILKFKLTYL